MEKIIHSYRSIIEENGKEVENLSRKIYTAGSIRLLLFVAFFVTWYIFRDASWMTWVGVFILYAIPFLALFLYHNRLSRRRAYAETWGKLCENELKAIDYDFSAFDGAAEKIDGSHSFSFDLDLFGERSFFQSVNRTVTHIGEERLAEWFLYPLTDKQEIRKRQESVKELSELTSTRQHFRVTGMLKKSRKGDIDLLPFLFEAAVDLKRPGLWKFLIWFVPLAWIGVFTGFAFGLIPAALLAIIFVMSMILASIHAKQVRKIHDTVDKTEKILSTYSRLMHIVENTSFASEKLRDIQSRLVSKEQTASRTIRQLSGQLRSLDQRNNQAIAILNIFTLRDIRLVINLEKWKRKNAEYVNTWFDALADFEAYLSLADFAYNHPDYIYPSISNEYMELTGKNIGHPLLHRDTCVRNDIRVNSAPQFMIITGANMAGKSTYLRTIGLNFLLACVGAPVCAEEFSVYPAGLVTSLRTSDSLTNNESYFFAELKRLKMIIDRLESGEKMFIILDEILKGTNSVDKQRGSLALIKQLVRLNACGIIATHDLILGSLEEEFPQYVHNHRFEADITGDTLTFTYKLQDGIARNMNAYYLMKKMGITV